MDATIGILMDPIERINPAKDSTLAMMLEAQSRGWEIHYFNQNDVYFQDTVVYAKRFPVKVFDSVTKWYELGRPIVTPLHELDCLLMRKDPPFDMNYIYTTYMLEAVEKQGTLVVNKPQALRDANEKMFTTWFPHCIPATAISMEVSVILEFIETHQDVIVKPLASMGGNSIFRIKSDDLNAKTILSTITDNGQQPIMAQKFIEDVNESGDKRIFVIDGQAIPFGLARKPSSGDFRANLAVGGTGEGIELSEQDKWLCEQIGPTLKEKGILIAGIDVIGDYITEINITSPTCIREIHQAFDFDISQPIFDCIEAHIRL